ncbi:MAG: hypothetical protein GY842_24320 [bacterium]|nr:hypothetical protein [bacterium]
MADDAPRCSYCGYNLTGLGEGTRCPECGMVSVPEALRREVWGICDSPWRLWGLMARPFTVHPPAWWWSLDRPGDLRRSFVLLAVNLVLTLLIILSGLTICDSVVVRRSAVQEFYDQADPQADLLASRQLEEQFHSLCRSTGERVVSAYGVSRAERNQWPVSTAARFRGTCRLAWAWGGQALWWAAGVFGWLVLVWAYMTYIGLCTQIRRGLPSFARPPRSIIAAANLQSCKLVLLAVLVVCGGAVELAARWVCDGQPTRGCSLVLDAVLAVLVTAASTMWIGALASDFTHQLVRSRVHIVRLLVMYAVLFPAVTICGLVIFVQMRMLS